MDDFMGVKLQQPSTVDPAEDNHMFLSELVVGRVHH